MVLSLRSAIIERLNPRTGLDRGGRAMSPPDCAALLTMRNDTPAASPRARHPTALAIEATCSTTASAAGHCVTPSSPRPWQRSALLVGMLAVVVLRLVWGHFHCVDGLPFYSIDENEVVEPTAGFLMGDWNHQYYTYGPLFMYLLSPLYAAAALLTGRGVHGSRQTSSLITIGTITWPVFSPIVILATLVVAVIETQRLFSLLAAVLSLVLLAVPVLRISSLHGAYRCPAGVFPAPRAVQHRQHLPAGARLRYALAGAWMGLAIATKPISGALIVPIALGVAFLRVRQEHAAFGSRPRSRDSQCLGRSFSDPRLYLALAVAIGTFSIGFPLRSSTSRISGFSRR